MMKNQVDVWQADLGRAPDLRDLLSRDELDRAGRLKFRRERERFIASRGLLRRILSNYTGDAPGDLVFSYSQNGKPYLSGSDIRFSISHSGDTAVYAIALEEVGIDVEKMREIDHEGISRFLSEEDRRLMSALPGGRRKAFFAAWTRKEALVKARGGCLSQEIGKNTDSEDWIIKDLDLPDCVVALAVRNRNAVIRTKHYKQD